MQRTGSVSPEQQCLFDIRRARRSGDEVDRARHEPAFQTAQSCPDRFHVAGDIGGVFKGEKLQSLLTRVSEAAANLQDLPGKANAMIGKFKVEGIIKETAATITETKAAIIEAKGFITSLQGQLDAMKLPETMTRTRSVIKEAQSIAENLQRTTEFLEKFSERIYERPPDLMFGKPPTPRWNETSRDSRP